MEMDRLPEEILHRILSFLSFREAVHFGVLGSKYHAIWRSFPALEADFDPKLHRNLDLFLRLIYNNLYKRTTNSLERLAIRTNFHSMFNPLGPDLIFFAASFNLRELELTNTDVEVRDNHKDGRHYSIMVPGSIFHLKTLTILKLDCFRFDTPHIVLDSVSLLKELKLSRSLGIQSFALKENTKLQSLEVEYCEDLRLLDLDALNLENFDFLGPFSMYKCEVVISPDTRALKTLRLKHANVSKSLLQEPTPGSQIVEQLYLKMSKTTELNWIQLDWANLKRLEFMGMLQLEKIDLISENLEYCILDMAWSPSCQLNFGEPTGKFLRSLSLLYSEKITGPWVEQHLDRFRLLEDFRVEGCCKLKSLKFRHDRLKNMKFLYCNYLDRLDIDTPLLESLEMGYTDRVPSHTVIRSKPLNVKISLFFRTSKPVPHEDLNRFLLTFNNCKELTLDFKSNFEQLFPTKLREDVTWLTPLYDVKNLKIDVRFEDDPKQSIEAFSNLLKCLFWLVPLPKCITFVTSTKEQSIKFGYCEFDEGTHPCCVYYPEQCWRHRLVSVELSNFDNDHPKSIAKKKELLGFLKLNASRLKTIRDDCDELPESSSSEIPESSSSEIC
ncbi:hypothetical protein SDJN03_17763, partial [Cucurbita argyrosperma subsp. sororia]